MLAASSSHHLNVFSFSLAAPVGRGSPTCRDRPEHKTQLAAPWPCNPGAFCSLGIDRRAGMTGSLHSAGRIQPGKVLSLVASITCQISNSHLKTEKPQRTGRFCAKDWIFLVMRGDLLQRHHVEHGHHLSKDQPGFKVAFRQ